MDLDQLLEEVAARAALPPPEEAARILKGAGVSVSELARVMGRSRVTVSRWVRGHRRPRGDDLVAYACHLAQIAATAQLFSTGGEP